MTYARDPYDTGEPPCLCEPASTDPVGATAEFCPAHGDPDKPAPEPPDVELREKITDAVKQNAVSDWNEDGDSAKPLVLEIYLDDAVLAVMGVLDAEGPDS